MVYRGHVRNGKVELDPDARLPEGAEVDVALRGTTLTTRAGGDTTAFEDLEDLIGIVDDLPPDASVNVDHYLYGHPRR